MTYSTICEAVRSLQRKYGESDPFRLCEEMGVIVLRRSLGAGEDAVKGFFLECKRILTITVNADLPLIIQKIIVAHELGHAVLHRSSGVHAFHDVAMYDESSLFEKEANLFAAELLLDDEDVLRALNCDSTFFAAAAKLMVPAELLDFKFRVLKWKGYQVVESPVRARSNFLRDMAIPANTDDDAC